MDVDIETMTNNLFYPLCHKFRNSFKNKINKNNFYFSSSKKLSSSTFRIFFLLLVKQQK
jgi:hypothetical protein